MPGNRIINTNTDTETLNPGVNSSSLGNVSIALPEFIEHDGKKLKKNEYPHYPYIIGEEIKNISEKNHLIDKNKNYCVNKENNKTDGFHVTDKEECIKLSKKLNSKFEEISQINGFPGCFTTKDQSVVYWNNKFRSIEEKFVSGERTLNRNHSAICSFNKSKIICKQNPQEYKNYKNLRWYKEREPAKSCESQPYYICNRYYNISSKKQCRQLGESWWHMRPQVCVDSKNTCEEAPQTYRD